MSKPELARYYSETGQSEGHGRGYVIPTRGDPKKGLPVYGVTSISGRYSSGIGNEDGLAQYAADVTLRWANENWTQLASKSDQDAYRGGRFRWKDHTNHLAQVGTDAHEWIEVDLTDGWGHPDMWGESLEIVDRWVELKQQHTFDPLFVEQTVFNPEFEYAGTLDFGGWIDGKLTLADVKTGRNLWENNRIQMAAMAKCPIVMVKRDGVWYEEEAPKWERFAFIHLRPNYYNPVTGITEKSYGEIEYMDPGEIDDLFTVFQGLLVGKAAEDRLKTRRKGVKDASSTAAD